ncbi:hypothetical protein ACF0H5_019974 [Mactra antiquata]
MTVPGLLQEFQWKQYADYSNHLCPSTTTSVEKSRGLSECGAICNRTLTCLSFIYVPMPGHNCHIMNQELTSTSGCTLATNAKYYAAEKTAPPFSCHPDDGLYHTFMLPDGDLFSYRVVHTLTSYYDAETDCTLDGGYVVQLTTINRLETIRTLMMTCSGFGQTYYYVGGSNADAVDFHAADAWKWTISGQPVNMNSTFWATGRPNLAENDHCVVIEGGYYDWKLNDDFCSKFRYYICEKNV